jgi:hypothetical protein
LKFFLHIKIHLPNLVFNQHRIRHQSTILDAERFLQVGKFGFYDFFVSILSQVLSLRVLPSALQEAPGLSGALKRSMPSLLSKGTIMRFGNPMKDRSN